MPSENTFSKKRTLNNENQIFEDHQNNLETPSKTSLELSKDHKRKVLDNNKIAGHGNYSTVFLSYDEKFAIKTPNDRHASFEFLKNEILTLNHLKKYKCNYIMDMLDYDQNYSFYTMLACEGNLDDLIKKEKLTKERIKYLLNQIVEAIATIQEPFKKNENEKVVVVHRDLKPENIMVIKNGPGHEILKIGDFGSSIIKKEGEVIRGQFGTKRILAPEVFKFDGYNETIDTWSIGCIALEMLTGSHVWADYPINFDIRTKMLNNPSPPTYPDNLDEDLKDFLDCCFEIETVEKKRCLAKELLHHKFLV